VRSVLLRCLVWCIRGRVCEGASGWTCMSQSQPFGARETPTHEWNALRELLVPGLHKSGGSSAAPPRAQGATECSELCEVIVAESDLISLQRSCEAPASG